MTIFYIWCACVSVENPLVARKAIEPREYQLNLYADAINQNTLIVLPTGMGKTIIAAMVIAKVLDENRGKALFLAPTKPLVGQHYETLKSLLSLDENEITKFTGEVDNEDRLVKWVSSRVIVSTPQVVSNDLKNGTVDISKFGIIVFDEAHRATGNYAYVHVATSFLEAKKRLILAITASPGGNRERFEEVTNALGIEKVLIKDENDEDVKKYVNEVALKVLKIKLPESVTTTSPYLRGIYKQITDKLRQSRILTGPNISRKVLASKIPELIERARGGEKALFSLIPYLSAAIRVDYAIEYLESQGVVIAYEYIQSILESEEKTLKKTASILRNSDNFELLMTKLTTYVESEAYSPKMKTCLELSEEVLENNPDSRIIIFTHFRKTSDILTSYLAKNSSLIQPVRFVGQASKDKDEGMNQKVQEEILQDFRNGKYNVLIATSVAEEGLDIPSTDRVIFYEPVPSEIRSIQRRGRTGRKHSGEVFILLYEGSRDTGYYYSSLRKETSMRSNIKRYEKQYEPSRPAKEKKVKKDKVDLFDFE